MLISVPNCDYNSSDTSYNQFEYLQHLWDALIKTNSRHI